jgi:hydrogenase maturation protease
MNWPRPIRIVGVGSPLGDDALAWEVVRNLRQRQGLPSDVEVYMVEGGQRLLDRLDGRGTLFLIDALVAGTRPGTIHRFVWPHPSIEALRPGSTHDLRPAEALRLAEALGIAPPHIVVFGIEVESLAPQAGPNPSVMAAVPELVQRLVQEWQGSSTIEEDSPEPIGREH